MLWALRVAPRRPAEAAEVAAAPAPAAMVFEEAASPKLQRFLDEQAANREKRREAAVKVKAELTAQVRPGGWTRTWGLWVRRREV